MPDRPRWDARARFMIISLLKNCAPLVATARLPSSVSDFWDEKLLKNKPTELSTGTVLKLISILWQKKLPNTENVSIGDEAFQNHLNGQVTKRLWIFSHDYKLIQQQLQEFAQKETSEKWIGSNYSRIAPQLIHSASDFNCKRRTLSKNSTSNPTITHSKLDWKLIILMDT